MLINGDGAASSSSSGSSRNEACNVEGNPNNLMVGKSSYHHRGWRVSVQPPPTIPTLRSINLAVECLHKSFVKLNYEGRVDDSRAVGMLKLWARNNQRFNRDFSHVSKQSPLMYMD